MVPKGHNSKHRFFFTLCLCTFNVIAADYVYDPLGRLTSVTYDNGNTIGYQYDVVGNIQTITTTAGINTDGDRLLDDVDPDDDNDIVLDNADSCPIGKINWLSNITTDYDSDGCRDSDEDLDDDNDSLTDIEEQGYGTNPTSKDTDRDGLDDGWEIANSLDPLDGFCPSYICGGGFGGWRLAIPLLTPEP